MGQIVGVANQDGEVIEFDTPILISFNIEHWLKRMEYSMKFSVSVTLQNCYHNFYEQSFLDWIKKWPT
jgi:hypothetical protein